MESKLSKQESLDEGVCLSFVCLFVCVCCYVRRAIQMLKFCEQKVVLVLQITGTEVFI